MKRKQTKLLNSSRLVLVFLLPFLGLGPRLLERSLLQRLGANALRGSVLDLGILQHHSKHAVLSLFLGHLLLSGAVDRMNDKLFLLFPPFFLQIFQIQIEFHGIV